VDWARTLARGASGIRPGVCCAIVWRWSRRRRARGLARLGELDSQRVGGVCIPMENRTASRLG
jgi:hypothetical protein